MNEWMVTTKFHVLAKIPMMLNILILESEERVKHVKNNNYPSAILHKKALVPYIKEHVRSEEELVAICQVTLNKGYLKNID